MSFNSPEPGASGNHLIVSDSRGTATVWAGGAMVLVTVTGIMLWAFLSLGPDVGAIAMLTGLLGAGLSHEVLHLIPAWVITRQRPTFTAAGSRRVGMTTRGTTTRQEAQLILGAPALLLPAATVGALMGTGSLRVGWLMALTTLLLGSGSDLHYVRKLSALPSCTLITDRGVAGYALVAQCSACATARRDLEASRKGTGG